MYSILRIMDYDRCPQSARELTAATWGQGLAFALKQANIWIENPEGEMELKANHRKALEFGKNVRIALREVWTDPAMDVFDIGFVSMPFGHSCNIHYWLGIGPRMTSSV